MLDERPKEKIKTTADAIRAYEAAARRASEFEKIRVNSQHAQKDKPMNFESSYPLLPLVFAILPAVASVLYGDIASGLLSDLLTLIVVGWILWSVSETSWKFYVNCARHDAKLRKQAATTVAMAAGGTVGANVQPATTQVPGASPTGLPASTSAQSESPTTTAPPTATNSPTGSTTRPQSRAKPQGMPSRYFAATTYLGAQVLGACIIHYARMNLSAGTKLVSNFNILLYLTVSLGRGFMRLNKFNPNKRDSSSPSGWTDSDEHREYAKLTGRLGDLDTKITNNDAVWEREINEIWSAINHVAVQLSKVKQRERDRERERERARERELQKEKDRTGKLPKIDERAEARRVDEKSSLLRDLKERRRDIRDPTYRSDTLVRESSSGSAKELKRRELQRRTSREFREKDSHLENGSSGSHRSSKLSRPGTASASPTLYEFDSVNDAEKAGGDITSKAQVKVRQLSPSSPSPKSVSVLGIALAIMRGTFSAPLVVCRALVKEAFKVVYVILAKRFGQLEVA
ncbi:hypothetical protein B0I72DRAFT_135020 [Yarrowia lipolytica]|jgi:hypothetical protein|uniref:Uncharacterized protein n=1 Tax=Yarrowia lipolytica TaxID=4952 RepID=A0A371CCU4_YARLL|nr:hypothetical protein B0I71DRAFT_172778 [Yarrowia lipolytica]RDW34288.1 hypothetical protein B0I72DRAFT_135020 [Yarrowia lipolytica]RDW42492.1 hypothetical protein B0I73DRAFT_127166 [Yarrowia lipolytica]RDW47361.1 hypothetical protein B0I74DRAFT_18882 [Yarrowia lipolytica]RDW53667.1 hypothetical protein B0I75DRAFT_21102 [Yarrowia lipolytica]